MLEGADPMEYSMYFEGPHNAAAGSDPAKAAAGVYECALATLRLVPRIPQSCRGKLCEVIVGATYGSTKRRSSIELQRNASSVHKLCGDTRSENARVAATLRITHLWRLAYDNGRTRPPCALNCSRI